MRNQNKPRVLLTLPILICTLMMVLIGTGFYQIPTVDVPTVTGTSAGVKITVKDDESNPQINVRSGPGTEYDKVGTLLANEVVYGIGRTEGGNWLLINYQGGPNNQAWVYSSYVDYTGDLPIVVVPNTPTPRVTNTIDPTLAAQFIITVEPTRLPTFTEPAPLSIPTFTTVTGVNVSGGVPMGMVILICLILGILIGLFTLSQRR
jgi:hypothetical protein